MAKIDAHVGIDNELLQSFVRVNVNEPEDRSEEKKSDGAASVEDAAVGKKMKKGRSKKKHKKAQAVKVVAPKRGRKRKGLAEELYTDKDRAAAVNLGTRDIKQAMKMKRMQERSRTFFLPEEADPAQFLALGNYEMARRDLYIALNFMNKALELNPVEKNALVARSRCHILLGQPEEGLKDAEAALTFDKTFLKAIYQKAESLYYLGDFEHSLMYFHRGLHIRPDHEGFKTGVEKAQKAIENALGIGFEKKSSTRSATPASKISSVVDKSKSTQGGSKSAGKSSNRLLRELAVDKDYLDGLLKNPDIKCNHKDNDDRVIGYIEEAVQYLNKRQEFWRQQLPPKKKK